MCSCPGPAWTPAFMRWSALSPTTPASWTFPDRDQPDAYLQLAQALARAGGQTLAIDIPNSPISSGCPRRSCGPSGTGCAAS